MATKLKSYSTTPGSNNSAPPNGAPEGMLPSTVNDTIREGMARQAEWYQDAEWILRNDTVTGFTGTTLTITGDVTSKYTVDRALRLDESNSKLAIITASSFAAGSTTVTVTGFTIIATPTAVELGVIDSSKNAIVTIRGAQTIQGAKTFSGALAMSAAAINTAVRVDVASAATVDLDAAATNYVRITGTTTITAITLADGRSRAVVFGGALTLTNGASLILPGAADITTAAGDTAILVGEAAGVVRVVSYSRAAPGPTSQATTSGQAINFTGISARARIIYIAFNEVSAGGTTDDFLVRIGDSGGIETAGYVSSGARVLNAGATIVRNATDGFIVLNTSASDFVSGVMTLVHMGSNLWVCGYSAKNVTTTVLSGGGSKTLSDPLDRITITFEGTPTDSFDGGSVSITVVE